MSELAPDPNDRIVQLEIELASIHHVHIDDIRALVLQFEQEQAEWAQKLQEAVGRECGALCGDVEQDRAELAAEVEKMRAEGVPGVMHAVDRAFYQAMIADRDRFAALHRNLGDRQRRLIGEYRSARYAVKLVGEVETLLGVALGTPGGVNRDNVLAAAAELVKERDHHREQAMSLASPDGDVCWNEQIVATLQQKIGEAVGTDISRERMVEMFDHLVSQYRTQSKEGLGAAECNTLLQDTVNIQQRTIDTQLEDIATQKRIAESQSRAYAGLESASQTVGQELTQQIRRNDKLRGRLRVADDLLHEANGIICNAENLKLTLKCLAAHCVERDHVLDLENPVPIGDQDWRDAQRRWAEQWHAFMDYRQGADEPDPLAGFAIGVFNDGRHARVSMRHSVPGVCTYNQAYPEAPGGIQLAMLASDARSHASRCGAGQPDEASPDDADASCEATCHPSHGACCGGKRNDSPEVNR